MLYNFLSRLYFLWIFALCIVLNLTTVTWVSPIYRADCPDEQISASLQNPAGSCSWDLALSGGKGWSSMLKPNKCSLPPSLRRMTTWLEAEYSHFIPNHIIHLFVICRGTVYLYIQSVYTNNIKINSISSQTFNL